MKISSLSSKVFFDSIKKYLDLNVLVHDGTAEDQFLECKLINSPSSFGQNLEAELRQEISGFSNTNGGVIAFGLDTDNKRGIDIITQICPIGDVKEFESKFKVKAPLLARQTIKFETKIIYKRKTDTKGILLTYIYPTDGDPVQASDGKFYMRVGDQTPEMPYEIIKRMFSGTDSPDLYPMFDNRLVELQPDGNWKIPIILENKSSAAARDVKVSVVISNFSDCETVTGGKFYDNSNINPGQKIFASDVNQPIHRGLNIVVGELLIKMKKQKLVKRKLELKITIYATNMRARKRFVTIQLAKKGFSVKSTKDDFLY